MSWTFSTVQVLEYYMLIKEVLSVFRNGLLVGIVRAGTRNGDNRRMVGLEE